MTTKKAIPFIQLFAGGERNARMALRDPKTPPELRAELERYLANPFDAAASDQQQLLDRAQNEADLAEKAAADAAAERDKLHSTYRSGRKDGVPNPATDDIRKRLRELLRPNPYIKQSELIALAKDNIPTFPRSRSGQFTRANEAQDAALAELKPLHDFIAGRDHNESTKSLQDAARKKKLFGAAVMHEVFTLHVEFARRPNLA